MGVKGDWESKPELPKIGKLLLAAIVGAEWPSRSQGHFHPSSNPRALRPDGYFEILGDDKLVRRNGFLRMR